MLKDIFTDSIKYIVTKGVIGGTNLLFIFIVINFLSKEIYTQFSYYLALSTAISSLSTSWLTQSLLREKEFDFRNQSFILGICFTVLITIFISLLSSFIFELLFIQVSILSISISVYFFVRVYFQKQRMIFEYFKYDLIRYAIMISLVFILGYFFDSALFIILAFSLSSLWAIFFVRFDIKYPSHFDYLSFYKECCQWFKFGIPVALWLSFVSLYTFIDRYIIESFLTYELLTEYTVLYDLVLKFSSLIIIPLSNAVYPILVRDIGKIKSYVKFSILVLISSILTSATVSILSFIAVKRYYDLSFLGTDLASVLLIYGIIQWQLALIVQKPIELMNKTALMLANVTLCILLSLTINFFWVSSLGISVFAFTLAASSTLYAVNTSIIVFYYSRKI